MIVQLSTQMAELLSEVIKKRCPHLTSLLDSPRHIELTDSQRDELQEAVGDEFLETGLEENDEPNKRGLLLEDLIGRLRRP
jgi:hypothetical protein